MLKFIKTTALGGLLFLIPIAILIAVFKQAHQVVARIAGPILEAIPVERLFGIAILDLLVVAALLIVCFLGGLAARTSAAVKVVNGLESGVLSQVPGYDVVKTKLTARLRFEQAGSMPVVLVRFDDQEQIGFEADRIDGGRVAIYLPGSPDAWSGAVSIVTADRVTRLEATLNDTLGLFKHFGKGTNAVLAPPVVRSPHAKGADTRDDVHVNQAPFGGGRGNSDLRKYDA